MNQPKPSPSDRKWRRSTRVFQAFLVAILLLLNVPGQIAWGPDILADGKYGPHFDVLEHCEHGRPFTYLEREPVMLDRPPYWRLSLWNIFEGVDRFNASILFIDAVLGCGIVLVAGFLFESWRRRRTRLLQFYIGELLIVIGIVAACAAVYVFHRSQHRNERSILQAINEIEDQSGHGKWDINERVEWQSSGPTWLWHIIGGRPFQVFDRVVGIDTEGGEEIKHVVKLSELGVVRIKGAVSNRQLKMLEQLPQLEALDMCFTILDDEGQETVDEDGHIIEQCFRLPRLPNLRGLNLYDTSFRGDGLENIPSVERLDLRGTDVDDKSVPTLAALTKLKKLALGGTAVSDSGIDQLRRRLPNCEILK